MQKQGRLPLYEAIGKSRGSLTKADKPVDVISENQGGKPPKEPREPIEICLNSYNLAIVSIFILVLLVITYGIGYKFGSSSNINETQAIETQKDEAFTPDYSVKSVEIKPAENKTEIVNIEEDSTAMAPVKNIVNDNTEQGSGDTVILIARYHTDRDLKPAEAFFDKSGIQTRIVKNNDWYYLVSTQKVESTLKQNSSGTELLENIKKVGASYKAPKGYYGFGSRGRTPFNDAYGIQADEISR